MSQNVPATGNILFPAYSVTFINLRDTYSVEDFCLS